MHTLPWIKLYTEIIDDPKLCRLSEAHKWRFVQLLALAGECDAQGYLCSSSAPLDPIEIAWRLRLDPTLLLSDLQALAQAHLIVRDEAVNAWYIPSFARRQSRPDEGARLYWREQKRRQRLAADDSPPYPPPAEAVSPDASERLISDNQAASVLEQPPQDSPLKRRGEQRRVEQKSRVERQKLSPSPQHKPPRSPQPSVLDQLESELTASKETGQE